MKVDSIKDWSQRKQWFSFEICHSMKTYTQLKQLSYDHEISRMKVKFYLVQGNSLMQGTPGKMYQVSNIRCLVTWTSVGT